jgi:hypothetical protein
MIVISRNSFRGPNRGSPFCYRKLRYMPKIRATADVAGQRIFLRSRGDVQMLKLLSDAGGDWITPKTAGIRGVTLSRHAAQLRRKYSLPVESETVPDGKGFFNRHRLRLPASIDRRAEHV